MGLFLYNVKESQAKANSFILLETEIQKNVYGRIRELFVLDDHEVLRKSLILSGDIDLKEFEVVSLNCMLMIKGIKSVILVT